MTKLQMMEDNMQRQVESAQDTSCPSPSCLDCSKTDLASCLPLLSGGGRTGNDLPALGRLPGALGWKRIMLVALPAFSKAHDMSFRSWTGGVAARGECQARLFSGRFGVGLMNLDSSR